LQNYGEQVGGLWSDVFRPGAGQTPLFQPREFDAAGEAAVDRFGLSGAGAGAVRGGATALDLLTGVAAGGVGGVGRGAVQSGAQTAGRVAQLAPDTRQLYLNSLLGRLYHGSNAIKKFDVDPTAGNISDNFFNANFFTTTSKDLAQTPGYGAGSSHRVKIPLETAENLNILNLYPGAPTVRDQFPKIADDLMDLGIKDFSVQASTKTTKDLPYLKQEINNPLRYMPFSRTNSLVPNWNDWFSERGVNVIRHQSGAATNNDIKEPVYAFLRPGQMSAIPNKTFSQGVGEVRRNTKNYLRSLMQRIREGNKPYQPNPNRPAYGSVPDDQL
jgi:hypothetical protein